MTYKGVNVFTWEINWSNRPSSQWSMDLDRLLMGFGPEIYNRQQRNLVTGWTFTCEFGESDIADVDAFMLALRGRANPFWIMGPSAQFRIEPAWSEDENQSSSSESSSSSSGAHSVFKITDQSYTTAWELEPNVYLVFTKAGHDPQCAQVLSVTDDGDGRETVTLVEELYEQVDSSWEARPLILVRMADDVEDITSRAERFHTRKYRVIELPTDYENLEAGIDAPSKPVWLYRFTAPLQDGDLVWRFTGHPTDVVLPDATHWMPVAIEHNAISRSGKLGGNATVKMDYDSVEPARLLIPSRIQCQITVEILKTTQALGAPTIVFTGKASAPKLNGRKITISCIEWGDPMEQRLPRFFISSECQYSVYDSSTCRASQASFEKSVTVTAVDGLEVTLESTSLSAATEDYYARGWLEIGTGVDRKTMFIASSTAYASGGIIVTVTDPPNLDLPLTGTLVPGCTGERSVCISKFNNLTNFGGASTPRSNLTLNAIKTNTSTGGKK